MAGGRPLKTSKGSWLARGLAYVLRKLRWLVIAAWIAAAVAAYLKLPSISDASTGAVGSLFPQHAKALQVEKESTTKFAFPLLSRTIVVKRDPNGLSATDQLDLFRLAAALTRRRIPLFSNIRGALPITNALGTPPFSREHGTTEALFLFYGPNSNAATRYEEAKLLIQRRFRAPKQGTLAVTGLAAAQVERQNIILDHLKWIEIASVILIALAVGLRFRAIGAPIVTLVSMGLAYIIANRCLAWLGERLGLAVPQEVEPVMIVLVFGVVTDYSIFFLSRYRAVAADGEQRLRAVDRSSAQLMPIIFTAGITVVAATSGLLAAHLEFFHVFGPGLAISVLMALLVAISFVPATIGTFRGALFWPSRPKPQSEPQAPAELSHSNTPGRKLSRHIRLATGHPWLTLLFTLAVLGGCMTGLRHLKLSNPIVRGLPPSAGARQAYDAAAKGFTPGILSPTVLVVSQPGVAHRVQPLVRLQRMLARQPGVATVLGPAQQPVAGTDLGVTRSRTGNAARYFIVFNSDPLLVRAIGNLRTIEHRIPRLLHQAGLRNARAGFAGDTALSAETIDDTVADLERITPAALGAIFIILVLYLRALVAPLYLVAASVAAFGAALGLSVYIFDDLLGFSGLTYFEPFAAAVLLVSLGSDYNVFLIGRIWQEAGRRPLREAVPIAVSMASKPITLAGFVLAGTFALAALVPLRAFYELALTMGIGLMLDAFLVRSLLVPALVMIVGETSAWPGKRFKRAQPVPAET